MKICIVTKNMLRGGAERVISYLIKYMLDQGHELSLVLIDDKPIQYEIPKECVVNIIGQRSSVAWKDKFIRYKLVRRFIVEKNCDIVLSMPEEIGVYVLASMIGTKIPVVVSERNNPWVMPYRKISRIMRRIFYPFADGLIFQTSFAASFFSKSQQKKGIVLPNPLDLTRIPQPYDGAREKVIVGAGRLEPQKNFKLLIDAFASFYPAHTDYQLVIYGEGKQRAELEAYAAAKLPEKVYSFPGNVPDLPDRINSAAAFVLSSDFEGMPNVLIEALAMGVPCVSTDCPSGGPKELIEDGVNGFLVNVGDSKAMADRLDAIVSGTALCPDAQQLRDRLDSQKVAGQWQAYLENVISRG